VRREVARDLALVADVERVDPRVRVVLVEDTNAREQRERSVRERRRRHNAWPDRRCAAELPEVVAADEDRLLLQTVGCDGANLAEHVLPREVDPGTRS